jgi:hypothetical protein
MRYKVAVKFLLSVAFFIAGRYAVMAQQLNVHTNEIETVIREWDFANNTRSVESFENVYADQLLFYTQTLSESSAIELKQKLFHLKPEFRQRIVSEIAYTAYTSGVIKCDFTKEVFEESRSRKYPSYLLVSYDKSRYSIVGESDYATDKTLKYRLDIGQPMVLRSSSHEGDTLPGDSSFATTASQDSAPESPQSQFNPGNLSSLVAPVSSMDLVPIPKAYIFVLIGMLVLGGSMIIIADGVQRRKLAKAGNLLMQTDEADNVIHELQMQSVFESFVITLFDPLYFRYRRPKAERVFAGDVSQAETGPDFELEFHYKGTHVKLAIKCIYYNNIGGPELKILDLGHHQACRRFEEEREMDVYYILGLGGTPDDPKELFLLPAKAVRSEYGSREALKPYRKSGMFFYNSATRRLQ